MSGYVAKVYVVTSGDYSAYGIQAIFATAEAAERWECDDKNDVEVWDVVGDDTPLFYQLELYENFRRRDGIIKGDWKNETRECGQTVNTSLTPFSPDFEVRVQPMCYSDVEHVGLHVDGMDFDKVRKTFTEKRAQIFAEFDIFMEQARVREAERDAKYEQWKLDHPQGIVVNESSQNYYTARNDT